ncbi:MAG: HNH endonuclease signature motif containing protein [Chthoniobacterales bacterium]
MAWEKRNDYEVDHLVILSIGGSNSIKNLWPELLRLNVEPLANGCGWGMTLTIFLPPT